MRVAIVHDWLVTYAGAEKVLEQLIHCYPDSDIYAVLDVLPKEQRAFLQGKKVKTSFLQSLPDFLKKHYQKLLPLMPLAVEQFDLEEYDLIISSSHAVAKGVLTKVGQTHVCYIHTPMRYAWDLHSHYLKSAGLDKGIKSWFARLILHYMRMWDIRSSFGVDRYVANSKYIARRVFKVYRREADVIYPPVDTEKFNNFSIQEKKENYYLTASRCVPYKKIDLIVDAFAKMPDKKLVVIGDGPEYWKIARKATANVEMKGYQSFEVLQSNLKRAKAFVFAAEEDFGILPVEAQACGTPVIAFGKGGATETVNDGLDGDAPTGLFFMEQSTAAIVKAVQFFEENSEKYSAEACKKKAEAFAIQRFRKEFMELIESEMNNNS